MTHPAWGVLCAFPETTQWLLFLLVTHLKAEECRPSLRVPGAAGLACANPYTQKFWGPSLALLCLRTTSFEATLGQDYSLAGASVRIVIDDRGLFLDVLILKRIKDIWGQIPT